MPMSQGNFSSGPVGLTLKAWGLINGTTGTLVKSNGLATFTRSGSGSYPFTFSAAAADANYLVVVSANYSSSGTNVRYLQTVVSKTAAGASINNVRLDSGTVVDAAMIHVAIYV